MSIFGGFWSKDKVPQNILVCADPLGRAAKPSTSPREREKSEMPLEKRQERRSGSCKFCSCLNQNDWN